MTADGDAAPDAPRTPMTAPWLVAVCGLIVFVVLAGLIRWWDQENEERLLQEQTGQAGVVLTVSINQFIDPLVALARVAEFSGGDVELFDAMATELRSSADPTPYHRLALIDAETSEIIARVGDAPTSLDADGDGLADVTDVAANEQRIGLDDRTLVFTVGGPQGRMIVYLERELSTEPNVRQRSDGPFGNLDYAIYLDSEPVDSMLLGSSNETPLGGPTYSTTIDYGDRNILLVTSPLARLGNSLLGQLWWIVLVVGAVFTAITTALVAGLLRSRERALRLAEANDRQHREQRDIAETFQLELLPHHMRPPPGCKLATRYWVADTAGLVGGDFYDAFEIDERRWGILIGDVCGKGTPAAALTGLVRYTVRTASRFLDSPAAVLVAVHEAMAEHEPPTYCTAAFMVYTPDLDAAGGDLVLALGGHPPPVHRRADGAIDTIGRTGTLLGLIEPKLHDAHVRLEPGDTVLAYTDGLTDAPGQTVEPHELLDGVATDNIEEIAVELRRRHGLRPGAVTDDTALLLLHIETVPELDAASVPVSPVGAPTA